MNKLRVVSVLMLVLSLLGCISPKIATVGPYIREFTSGEAIEVLGLPRMANATTLEARFAEFRSYLVPQFAEALSLVRAGEAIRNGATAKDIVVFVIDDFSSFKFKDGRFHGDYVSALIKLVAPEVTVLTCDAWRRDLGECLFDANQLAAQGKIQIVNMSLGIVGTYCEFMGTSFEWREGPTEPDIIPPFNEVLFDPLISGVTPEQAEALENWVLGLRQKGVTVLSSAGNEGYKRGAKAPGCWSSSAVGAVYDAPLDKYDWKRCVDENVNADDRVCWSNYGQLFAPGAKIDNVFQGGISFNGTSAAAPIASGVAALVAGTKKLKGDAVAEQMIKTADPIPDRFETKLPHRRVNAVTATGVGAPTPPPQTLRGFLDKNKNCVLDDSEILTALNLWISGTKWNGKDTISDAEMISLLRDWIKKANICTK